MKRGHEFISNGCGAMGIKVNTDPRIIPCCDVHDACYASLVYLHLQYSLYQTRHMIVN